MNKISPRRKSYKQLLNEAVSYGLYKKSSRPSYKTLQTKLYQHLDYLMEEWYWGRNV